MLMKSIETEFNKHLRKLKRLIITVHSIKICRGDTFSWKRN